MCEREILLAECNEDEANRVMACLAGQCVGQLFYARLIGVDLFLSRRASRCALCDALMLLAKTVIEKV